LESFQDSLRHFDEGKKPAEAAKFLKDFGAIMQGQPFFTRFPFLRCIQAEPDLPYPLALGPETGKFFKVTLSLNDLPGDGAVDRDPVPGDVLLDAIVSCRRPAAIVFGLKAINGNGKAEIGKVTPRFWNGPHGAGYEHHLYPHIPQFGEEDLKFTIAHQRLTTHNGNMQRAEAADQPQNSRHQGLSLGIAKLAERARAAQMFRVVCITARTRQWTFFSDFN
jgi:hypothetical protein